MVNSGVIVVEVTVPVVVCVVVAVVVVTVAVDVVVTTSGVEVDVPGTSKYGFSANKTMHQFHAKN